MKAAITTKLVDDFLTVITALVAAAVVIDAVIFSCIYFLVQ